VLYAIPAGIFGAACFYSATFTIRTGFAMLSQRFIDARRTVIIGTAIVVAVIVTDSNRDPNLPLLVQQVLSSPLASAMLLALALNVVLRLGVPKAASLAWRPAEGFAALKDFAETQGRAWGARVELFARVEHFLEEFSEVASSLVPADRTVDLQLRYDETGVQIALAWQGPPLPTGTAVNAEADDGSLQLALMRHWADEMQIAGAADGRQTLVAYVDDR
jgi:NCS2 family nucleobase:cation symporter-2